MKWIVLFYNKLLLRLASKMHLGEAHPIKLPYESLISSVYKTTIAST